MSKGLSNPRITLLYTNAEVLRLLLKNDYLHEVSSSRLHRPLSRRFPGQTMGQMGSLHKARHHRMRKDQCSWALPSCTDIFSLDLVQRHLMRWRTASGAGRCWSSLDAIHLNQRKNLIIWYYLVTFTMIFLDELPFSRVHPKPAGEGSLGLGIIPYTSIPLLGNGHVISPVSGLPCSVAISQTLPVFFGIKTIYVPWHYWSGCQGSTASIQASLWQPRLRVEAVRLPQGLLRHRRRHCQPLKCLPAS